MLRKRLLDARTSQQVHPAPLVDLPPLPRKLHHFVDLLRAHDYYAIEVGEGNVARVDGCRGKGGLEGSRRGGLRVDLKRNLDARHMGEGRLAEDRVSASKDLRLAARVSALIRGARGRENGRESRARAARPGHDNGQR